MVQPIDYIHKSGVAGLNINNFISRVASDSGAINTTGYPTNTLMAQPFFTGDEPLSIAGVGICSLGTGSAQIKIAIYDVASTRDIYPRNMLHDLGIVTNTTAGARIAPLATTFLAGKMFWVVTNIGSGTGSLAETIAPSVPFGTLGLVTPAGSAISPALGLSVSYNFSSTMPAVFPSGATQRAGDFPAIIIDPS